LDTAGYDSAQELLGDIERIWLGALEKELGIAKSDLKVQFPSLGYVINHY
jgi:hypothetical protein